MRLSASVAPLSYQLTLTVDPEQGSHSGEVSVAIDIKLATSLIRLHASGIDVSSAVLKIGDRSYVASVGDGGNKALGLSFARALPVVSAARCS